MKYPTLETFLEKGYRNAYLDFPGFDALYVRSFKRYGFPSIDLANLEATEPGNGAFTRLLLHIREKHPSLGIFVECVLTDRFAAKLRALGFSQCDESLAPSFFLSPLMELKLSNERCEANGAVRQAVQTTARDQV